MTQPNIPFDLRAWRKERNIGQKELAFALRISTPQIWRLERAGVVPMLYIWALRGYDGYRESAGRERAVQAQVPGQ